MARSQEKLELKYMLIRSSSDETANVNFLTTTSCTYYKIQNYGIQRSGSLQKW